MKASVTTALATALLLTANTVETQDSKTTLTGADFLSACSRPDPDWISFCHGYVQAVFDGVRRPGEEICPPAGFARAKIVGIVVGHLNATPELRSLNAASVVYGVLLKTFPCR